MIEETNTLTEPADSIMSHITNLPETIQNHATHLTEQADNMVAKKMTGHLVNNAKHYLESLISQKKHIEDSTSHLALLMQRVNIQKSAITRASEWYGQKTWFEKASIGVMFVTAASLIGAIVNVGIIFGVLATGLCGAVMSILQEHYIMNLERDERFCSDIHALEQALTESVEHLKELEEHLRNILIELAEKNIRSAEQILQFENHVGVLDAKIIDFKQAIIDLEGLNAHLTDESARITAQLNTAHVDLEAANNTLIQQTVELDCIQRNMRESHEQVAAKTSELNALCEKFQAHSKAMSVLIEGYETQLELLRTHVSTPVPDEKTDDSMNETMELRRQTHASIASDDALIAQIRLNRQTRSLSSWTPTVSITVSP